MNDPKETEQKHHKLPEDKQFIREHVPQGQRGSTALTAGRAQVVTQGCQSCGLPH